MYAGIGKVSFKTSDLEDNLRTVLDALKGAKPGSLKTPYVNTIYLTTSMGPSIRISSNEL